MVQEEITVAFLDVEQGDCTVIVLPDGVTAIVVDCPEKHAHTAASYLEGKGVDTLHVFVSHTDMDHFGGIAELVENFEQVVSLAYNETLIPADPQHPGRREVVLRHLKKLIDSRPDIVLYGPRAGKQWTFQGVDVVAIHPEERDVKRLRHPHDANNGSTVLRITFAGYRVLLTGDVGGKGWQWIIARGEDLQAHVLKFPHHGAWHDGTSTQPPLDEILLKIGPELVVLSVGTRNPHGHPKPDTLKLLRTRAKLRFVCTEATSHCFGNLHLSGQHPVPCAGTVEVRISAQGMVVIPFSTEHFRHQIAGHQ